MHKFKWEVDHSNIIELKLSALGFYKVHVNENEVLKKFKLKARNKFELVLDDGRKIQIKTNTWNALSPSAELMVDDVLFYSNINDFNVSCPSCHKPVKINDKFCENCGTEILDTHDKVNLNDLKEAKKVIRIISILYLVFGVLMFGIQLPTYNNAFANLKSYENHEKLPNKINGKYYTAGELRSELTVEKYSLLVLNLFLAGIMLGLYFYADKNAFLAIVIAASVFVAINVLNAVVDPKSIGQGIIMKAIILSMLYKGLKAGFRLRVANKV